MAKKKNQEKWVWYRDWATPCIIALIVGCTILVVMLKFKQIDEQVCMDAYEELWENRNIYINGEEFHEVFNEERINDLCMSYNYTYGLTRTCGIECYKTTGNGIKRMEYQCFPITELFSPD
jgi:hypothetical protein